jgi:molybdopterin molybdotransferase
VVLRRGCVLRPVEVGLLAAVGRARVRAVPRPTAAVLSTGDELVEAPEVPGPGQIRNSNGPLLAALAAREARPSNLGIARDRLESLGPLVRQGLEHDVLILSGGVSAGKLDLVPAVLKEAGVEACFHKVRMKPGKPVYFGTRANPSGRSGLVFGLPGNPVSALVCFELFVRPALRRLGGQEQVGPRSVAAALGEDFAHASDRPTYYPAQLEVVGTGWQVRPAAWFGSADLRGLARANGLMILPAGEQQRRAGDVVEVIVLE